jgi:hypothetical protein
MYIQIKRNILYWTTLASIGLTESNHHPVRLQQSSTAASKTISCSQPILEMCSLRLANQPVRKQEEERRMFNLHALNVETRLPALSSSTYFVDLTGRPYQ